MLDSSSNILLIRGGALGDFILTLPLLHTLRRFFPMACIELMTNPLFIPLASKYINKGKDIDKIGMWNFFSNDGELLCEFKDYFRCFDLIILLRPDKEGLFRGNIRRAGVKNIIYHHPIPPNNSKHISAHLIDSLLTLGITSDDYIPEIEFADEEMQFAKEFLSPFRTEGMVAIHPGSGGDKKNWMVEEFAGVANILSENGMKVILISGAADKKQKEKFLNLCNFNPVVAENISLMKLAAIFKNCDFYIGNDSGVTHLSALTGINTIAIFGPTDPAVWCPLGKKITVIHKHCLSDLNAEEVLFHLPLQEKET